MRLADRIALSLLSLGFFLLPSGCAPKVATEVPTVPAFQYEQAVHNEGFRGKFAFETHEVITVVPDKKATDSSFEFTGEVLGKLTGKKQSRQIARLDQDLIWEINLNKKLYQEYPIRKASLQLGVVADDPTGETVYVENCCNASTNIRRSGTKKLVNGFDAELVVLTWSSACQAEAGEANTTRITMEVWIAPTVKLGSQLQQFDELFIKKTGMDVALLKSSGAETLKLFPGLRELARMLAGLQGYPILTTVTIEDTSYLKRFAEERARKDAQKQGSDKSLSVQDQTMGFLSKKLEERNRRKEDEENLKWGNAIWRMSSESRNFKELNTPVTTFELPPGLDKVEQKEQLEGGGTGTAVIEAKPAHYVATACFASLDKNQLGIDLYPGSRPARPRPYSEGDHNTRWYYKNRSDYHVQFATVDPVEKIVAFYTVKFGKNACTNATREEGGEKFKAWTCVGKGITLRTDERPVELNLDFTTMTGGSEHGPALFGYSLHGGK